MNTKQITQEDIIKFRECLNPFINPDNYNVMVNVNHVYELIVAPISIHLFGSTVSNDDFKSLVTTPIIDDLISCEIASSAVLEVSSDDVYTEAVTEIIKETFTYFQEFVDAQLNPTDKEQ